MQEVLVRRGEVRVPLPAREAARMRHKRNRARELGRQGIPCTRGTGSCLGWHVCLTEPKALRRRAACPIRLQRWR